MKAMKKLIILLLAAVMTACDSFLETTPDDLVSPDELFATESSTEGVLMGVYSFLRRDLLWVNSSSGVGGSSSDLDYAWTNYTTYNEGTWNASSNQYGKWALYYQALRECNYFLANLDNCPEAEIASDIREKLRAEARCLRAIFYCNLMRMYGPVILLKDEVVDITTGQLTRARSPWDECVDWVANELLEVSKDPYLPVRQTGSNYARMSQSIALGYRARLLLQSASAQFNGNSMYSMIKNLDGTRLFPQDYDATKWEKARQAAKDVMDLGVFELVKVTDNDGNIEPFDSYKAVFCNSVTTEMIFPYLQTDSHFDLHAFPNSMGGWMGYGVTQEMIDLYAMDNGRYPIDGYLDDERMVPNIDEESGYVETGTSNFRHPIGGQTLPTFNMYVGREPRFYVSVYYGCSGLKWFTSSRSDKQNVIEMFYNGSDGPANTHNYCSTGYALVKFLMPDFSRNPTVSPKREVPFMRYAEVLLNYIEATIECGQENPALLEDTEMFKQWDDLRARVGLEPILDVYPEAKGNYDMLLKLCRRERRVELAFECHSFFDTRRWLTAGDTEGGYFHKMNISSDALGTTTSGNYPDAYFQRTLLEKRAFNDAYYLYPIPQSAINRNPELVQNYKW